MANKTVMRLHVNDCYKCKKIALHSVTEIEGIEFLSFDMKESTLTVMGDADPVCVANMLRRKFRCAEVVYAGATPPPPPPSKPKDPPASPSPSKPKDPPAPPPPSKPEDPPAPPPPSKPEDPPAPPPPSKPEDPPAPPPPSKPKDPPAPPPSPPRPKCCHVCGVWCCPQCSGCSCRPVQYYPPCSACSCRQDILWPRYNPPCANPGEVWYVWNEERQESCTVM